MKKIEAKEELKLKAALTKKKKKKIIINGKIIEEFYTVKDVHDAISILCHRFNYLWRDGEKDSWHPKTEEDMEGIFKEIHRCFPVILDENQEKCLQCGSTNVEFGVNFDSPEMYCKKCGHTAPWD